MTRNPSGADRSTKPPTGYTRFRGRTVALLQRHVSRPVRRYAPLAPLSAIHRLRRRVAPSRYSDASPFKLVRVDPTRIRRSVLETAPGAPQWGRVVDGDWDAEWEPFDERAVPRGIERRYEDGYDWRETALYDAFRDQLARFGNAWGHTSIDAFETRCGEIDSLYESLREHGYRRQADIHAPDATYTTTARLDEITVDIGRGGELYWRAYGQHRLAIAKLLGIESVPVVVHRRHAAWQRVRDAVRNGRSTAADVLDERVEAHPDLRTIGGVDA